MNPKPPESCLQDRQAWEAKLEQAMLDGHLIVAIDIVEREISKARKEALDEAMALADELVLASDVLYGLKQLKSKK